MGILADGTEDGPERRCVFHGTGREFERFEESFLGTGPDCNSALGFHFTDVPGDAADYAESQAGRSGGEARILCVRTLARNPHVGLSYYAFFGYDEGGRQVRDHAGFTALRAELRAGGYDAVAYEDSEQDIFVLLDPAHAEIVAVLTPEEARACHEGIAALADRTDDEARFAVVEAVVAARSAPAP